MREVSDFLRSYAAVDPRPAPTYPYRGLADQSWPACPNCEGHGYITKELAIARANGLKGEPCPTCNAVGRVPEESWPACPEGCGGEATCVVCGGLGALSPARAAAITKGELRVPCKHCEGAGHVAYRGRIREAVQGS
jgi:DnaJ-class molecular chaperone